jgi:hypothetical protein
MRPLDELVHEPESALQLVQGWIAEAVHPCEILPPSNQSHDVLLRLQVTTRSPLGAIAYSTGGILMDHGYLRVLGSGHPRLARNIVDWNEGRSSGFLLVADDVVGGFFALNGGGLGDNVSSMYYLAPDSLDWEPLEVGFSDFLKWSTSAKLHDFYSTMRWPGWESDIAQLAPDECFTFYPYLWTSEGSVQRSRRSAVGVAEQYMTNVDFRSQLNSR